jgi:hypothetical protein
MLCITSKTITMVLNLADYIAIISPSMGEGDEIYTALRSARAPREIPSDIPHNETWVSA